jgi:hypothetical protein
VTSPSKGEEGVGLPTSSPSLQQFVNDDFVCVLLILARVLSFPFDLRNHNVVFAAVCAVVAICFHKK